jgi:hypothetical protein
MKAVLGICWSFLFLELELNRVISGSMSSVNLSLEFAANYLVTFYNKATSAEVGE